MKRVVVLSGAGISAESGLKSQMLLILHWQSWKLSLMCIL